MHLFLSDPNEKPGAFPVKPEAAPKPICLPRLNWEPVAEALTALGARLTYFVGVAGAVKWLWDVAHQCGLWR